MHDPEGNPETEEEIGMLVDVQSLPGVVTDFFAHFSAIALPTRMASGAPQSATTTKGASEEKTEATMG
jgi:hypothetical protein